ncbi:retinitis pigmentosa 9 protein-like isoform X2 [Orcinus orca]|uniref:retinitis pigmentosa 9 protein-like isoform X2 n=1 Tax=Orcinus orca TaxID=9733 RepID=UPI002111C7DD|nr:retinitis pigmentosa 9 protein-like isoform X2 [Orcinus orca]
MSSRLGRDDSGTGGARRPREPPKQELQRRREQRRRRHDAQQLQQLKHLESFYEKPPPGLIKEDETKPEDCIPDVPGSEHAREFLAHAPTKGLWMPLGKEVKVMQSWDMNSSGNKDNFEGSNSRPFFYVHPVAQQLHLGPWYQNAVYNPFSIPGAVLIETKADLRNSTNKEKGKPVEEDY